MGIGVAAAICVCAKVDDMTTETDEEFFANVPLFSAFEGVTDADNYRPLPEGWVLALARIRRLCRRRQPDDRQIGRFGHALMT
ncbi:hypothetical protein B5E41_06815 [Rhizobium esperanzae]|uniref:Uncharacterized protein n=1 Tax=Rhizobium esperanzae TaxID=1967781 RepID=A0A246DYT9_9HYPH|nr:hypothetical protein B5E41_06815 [Rhizobium esperanzae]